MRLFRLRLRRLLLRAYRVGVLRVDGLPVSLSAVLVAVLVAVLIAVLVVEEIER